MRSLLFVPADSERKLARGLESDADAVILDLEDSVAAANRPTARKLAREFLEAHGPDRIRRYVRINPLASGLALYDLAATVAGRPDGILLPKCTPDDVRTADHYLSAFEAACGAPLGAIRIVAIATETPQAVFALGGYAGISPRLEAITWGAEDLSASIGGSNRTIDGDYDGPYKLARSLCLLAASAAQVVAIDTIYTDFRDPAGVRAEALAARRSGFAAKRAIHPGQLAIINEAFSVSAAERDQAERVVAAFAAEPNAGTLALDGKMIDKPHLVLARRLLGQN
ncbi:MAG: HpcH/HpaI aldolase/citrate lyase family protein [Stellaceae bacterium]